MDGSFLRISKASDSEDKCESGGTLGVVRGAGCAVPLTRSTQPDNCATGTKTLTVGQERLHFPLAVRGYLMGEPQQGADEATDRPIEMGRGHHGSINEFSGERAAT